MKTAKLLLVAEIKVPKGQTAEGVLDAFREAVQPSAEYGITLCQATKEDIKALSGPTAAELDHPRLTKLVERLEEMSKENGEVQLAVDDLVFDFIGIGKHASNINNRGISGQGTALAQRIGLEETIAQLQSVIDDFGEPLDDQRKKAAALSGPEGTRHNEETAGWFVRQEAADDAFAKYDFGEESVEDTNGWATGKDIWTRVFFLEGNGGTPSTRHFFRVKFKPGTAEVDEAFVE